MQCREFREVADSFLSDELLVETNHDMITHLEACADCRRELGARRELRTTLRTAFTKAEELRIDDRFSERLGRRLHEAATIEATSVVSRRTRIAIAACLLVATIIVLVAWRRQRVEISAGERYEPSGTQLKPTNEQPTTPTAVDADLVLAKMSELAAGDHRDCAIGHRLPDRPIELEDAGRKYDRAYLNLTPAVMSVRDELTDAIELVMAHACLFKGHWFGHIVVRHRGRLVSLLVTKLVDPSGNASATEKLKDAKAQVIACSTAAGYRIACFRTARHAVFVVSDLEEPENLALARGLARSVYEHITRAEDVT